MTTLDLGLTAAFALTMILVAGAGVLQALVAITLVAYFVYPRILFGEVASDGPFNGIAPPSLVILTWHVAIAAAFIYVAFRGKGMELKVLWPVVPLVVFATVFYSFVWVSSRPLTGGFLHLLTVSASWAVGSILFGAVHSTRGGERVLSKWIAGVASFIALVCILQAGGIDINDNSAKLLRSSAGAFDTIAGIRVAATFNEPTAAGKFLLLLAIIATVWLFGRNAQKKYSILFFAAVVVVALLTQTRTNAAAVLMLLLLYSVLSGPGRSARFFLAGGSAAVFLLASRPLWEARNSEDQSVRVHTLKVAWDFITSYPDTWLYGIGPNRYFEVLAPMDAWVALNYPVHNYFLYLLVEMGLAGTLAYLFPSAVLTLAAVKSVRYGDGNSSLAKAWLCALPSLLLVTMFGWGMLNVAAPALFLIMGYVYASLNQDGGNEDGLADPGIQKVGLKRAPERALRR